MAKIGLKSFRIEGPVEMSMEYEPYCIFDANGLRIGRKKEMKRLPSRYIINKGATILFWDNNDKEKTIVKLSDNDKYDKRLGFLTAYFQYNSGLSKTQANKYLDNLVEEKGIKNE